MNEPSLQTAQLHHWLDRMRAGDEAARDDFLRETGGRLERLARKMLRRFPRVARWEQTDDVLQGALLRLLRALQAVRPASVREFFSLAAEQLRRTLLDLARHHYGPLGVGANHESHSGSEAPGEASALPNRAEPGPDLERWSAFHQAVATLPDEEREAFGLLFYHGWTQAEVAAVLQVSDRTVRRQWHSACVKLREALHGEFPEA